MKVVILAGGFGTRLGEDSERIPKPMTPIGGRPLLWHIMKIYDFFGYKEFCIALGYKAEMIKDYFLHYRTINSDFTVNMETGQVTTHQQDSTDWQVSLVDTGFDSMTGGRVKRIKPYVSDSTFMLTYGDGLADVDIGRLLDFHKSHGKMVTVTAVNPVARFGELTLDGDLVKSFQEKPQVTQGWINGGFFVIEPDFFDLIEGDRAILERAPLEKAAQMGELAAYQHQGFWQCMDTKRDAEYLERMWKSGDAPWLQ